MLKSSQPTTPIPASPQVTSTTNDAFKSVKKKQNLVEESSTGIGISLSTGITAFNDYKALIQGANQFLLPRHTQLLSDFGVFTIIDPVQERDARLEELKGESLSCRLMRIGFSWSTKQSSTTSRPTQHFDGNVQEYSRRCCAPDSGQFDAI
ncbi:hypothetical protein ACOSQ2_027758 [Xanthoceras sorbifolium]